MKTLIIGGSGGIGQGLFEYFEDTTFVSSKTYDVLKPGSENFEEFDVVINLSGLIFESPLCNYNIITKRLVDINCIGAVNILADFLPGMKKRKFGRVIMFSSIYSSINVRNMGIYSASKAFVDKLVNIAALENAEYGVTVNSIQLGYTGLGMGDVKDKEKILSKVGMKRFVTMEEIYNTIQAIVNTEYLTGQNIRLDGGMR